jgi:hypothetical protein
MLRVRLRPVALAELTDAWRWYEEQREGLGDEFRACVDTAMAEIGRRSRGLACAARSGAAWFGDSLSRSST